MADFSLSVGAGDAGGGNQHGANCYGSVWESGTDTAGNYSTVSWSLSASYYCRSGWTWGGSTRSNAGYLDMVINGNVVGTITMSITNGWGNGAGIGSTSGSVNIGHGSDGNGSCSAYIRVRTGEDNRRVGVVYSSGQSGSQTIWLSSIGRASQPSINTWPGNSPDITCGQACTIHMNRASSSFTHSIWWQFGSSDWHTDGFAKTSGITDNVAWTPPISMMAKIPNAKSGTGTIYVSTYSNGTEIGHKTVNFTLHQPSDSAPTISSVAYAENGTLADGSTKLTSKGVGNTTVIGQISKKVITITASTKYSSTLSKITCTHNGSTQTATTSPASFTFNYPANTGNNKSYFSWTVTDSRGNSTSGSTSMTYVNYIKPVVAVATPKRDSAIVSTGKLSGNGMFFNGTVGSIANSITVTYTYNSADHTASVTKSGNNWSFSNEVLSGVDPNGNYSITVKVVDTMGFSSSKTIVLPKATPTLWIGKETVRVNDYLVAKAWSTNMGRPTSANIQYGKDNVNGGSVRHYLVTGSMTEGKPAHDGYITQFSWDSYGWDTQVFIADGSISASMEPNTIQIRGWNPTNPGSWMSAGLLAYPVGSIYISVNSTSPANLFGGTWEEITGQFLLARDSSHPAGSTGGEYNHALTENEIPRHNHYTNSHQDGYPSSYTAGGSYRTLVNSIDKWRNFGNDYGDNSTAGIEYTGTTNYGGSQSHNNTPPYLSVYMWKRTA